MKNIVENVVPVIEIQGTKSGNLSLFFFNSLKESLISVLFHNAFGSFYLVKFFSSLSVSHNLKKSKNEPRKTPNLVKNRKFCQNHQKSTKLMLVFCDNSFHKSLVFILKYTVYKFYDSMTLFDKMTIIYCEFEKKIDESAFWKSRFIKPKQIFLLIFQEVKKTFHGFKKKKWALRGKKLNFFFRIQTHCHFVKRSSTIIKFTNSTL